MIRLSGIRAMVLTDEKWAALKAALDAVRPGTGRPLGDERRTVEGVIWRLRNGARWRSVPAEYGPWWRPAQLHIRWSKAGSGRGCSSGCATRAGGSWARSSWTGRSCGPTRRRPARAKRGDLAREGPPRGARALARR